MSNYVDINQNELNKEALKEYQKNEKRIKHLLRIPKKRITAEEQEELRYRVWNRVNIIHRLKK